MFKLLATAFVIVSTRNFGSKAGLILVLGLQATDLGCLMVNLFCLCQESFDSLGSLATLDIVEAVVSIAAAWRANFS